MKKVLVTGTALCDRYVSALSSLGFEVLNGSAAALEKLGVPEADRKRELTQGEISILLPEFSIYVYGGLEAADESVIGEASALELVAFMGTGWSEPGCVDAKAASQRRIKVTNTPHANAASVAELTVGLLICAERNAFSMNRATKGGAWVPSRRRDIAKRTLGIVGLGEIGTRVARHAKLGFGMNVVYYSRSRKQDVESELGITYLELDDLLKNSDYVSLHTPGHLTAGLIGKAELSKMKSDAILLNLSVPGIVDGPAVYDALESSRLRMLVMDGIYKEPLGLREKFLSMDDSRLVVLPRTAWLTDDSYSRMSDMALSSIKDFVDGKKVLSNQVL
jgi:lactate dehydrogenase-like 2-hydroxyacid dehydrogenase